MADRHTDTVEIREMHTARERRAFAMWPRTLYRGHPCWIPPLLGQEIDSFNPKKNALLAGSDAALFTARKNGVVTGRVMAHIHRKFNEYQKTSTGFFGCFEAVEDEETASALLDRAASWNARRGMTKLLGPIHQFGEMWGLQIDAFDRPPVFLSPYNHPYYPRFMDERGFRKAKDLLVYEADRAHGYEIPERFLRFERTFFSRRSRFTLRRLDRARLPAEAAHIASITNAAVAGNWGYVPYEEAEVRDMLKAMKILIDPDAVWFIMDQDEPVGYCLGFPDVNVISRRTNGRLFPTGILRILFSRRSIKNYRLFGLAVLPRYHGLGLDVLLYVHLAQALSPKGIRLEVNYILEDNLRIKNAIEKLKLERVKTYRVYEKDIG